MVRQIQVTVPTDRADRVLELLSDTDHVFGLQDFPGSTHTLIIFKMAEKRLSAVLSHLCAEGIGVNVGTIDIIQLASTIPRLASAKRTKKAYRMDDRMTAFEIFDSIDGQSRLTCDYLANCFVAAMIAASGLVSDSSVTVVASMLVSPLMGPILGVTFGTAIQKKAMVMRSIRNEAYGMLICVFVGIIAGLVVSPFFGPGGLEGEQWHDPLISKEIDARGSLWALTSGVCVAIPSGMGVALGMTAGGINALVGVAISAALLPPMVNVGLCFSLSMCFYAYEEPDEGLPWLKKAGSSLALYTLNIVVIFCFSLLVFRCKNVTPESLNEKRVVKWDKSVESIFVPGEETGGFCCCNRNRRRRLPSPSEDAEELGDFESNGGNSHHDSFLGDPLPSTGAGAPTSGGEERNPSAQEL